MKQLAERAGVAAGTIYLYFRDKEDLIRQLHADIIVEVGRQVFSQVDTDRPLFDQYRQIAKNLWHFSLKSPEIMLSKSQFEAVPPDVLFGGRSTELAALIEKRDEVYDPVKPLSELYEVGRARGELKPLPDKVLSAMCIDPLCVLVREQYLGFEEIDEPTLEATISACWDAIRVH